MVGLYVTLVKAGRRTCYVETHEKTGIALVPTFMNLRQQVLEALEEEGLDGNGKALVTEE